MLDAIDISIGWLAPSCSNKTAIFIQCGNFPGLFLSRLESDPSEIIGHVQDELWWTIMTLGAVSKIAPIDQVLKGGIASWKVLSGTWGSNRGFHKWGYPKFAGWFIRENPVKMDDN